LRDGPSVYNQEMGANEELHRLILSEGGDPPLIGEDWVEVREAEAEIERGEFVRLADLKRELDL
jgi:hypothetical protein